MDKKKKLKVVVLVDVGPPYLPHDIIKRLPVKTLLRFRCVCKDWNILLKTPSFITQHLTHHAHHNDFLLPPTFLFIGRRLFLINHDLQFIQYHNVPSSIDMQLIGSCNGLLCLHSLDCKSLILWNPATRDILHLPPRQSQYHHRHTHCTRRVFGLGFSATVNDYKIVTLYCNVSRDGEFHLVEVFSLSTASWKELAQAGTTLLAMDVIPDARTGFNFDGAIFWFGSKLKQHDLGMEVGKRYLISFDIATELFILIPISKHFDALSHLTTHENKLAMLTHGVVQPNGEMPTSGSHSIELWVTEKSKDESGDGWIWTKLYTINPYPQCPLILMPCTLWRNQLFGDFGEFVSRNDGTIERQFVLCCLHLHTNEFKTLARGELILGDEICNYAESLVSLRNYHI